MDGEVVCQVHLSAAVRGLMRGGGAVLVIREIQRNTREVVHYCSCRLAAEFYLENVGMDDDRPFPMFEPFRKD